MESCGHYEHWSTDVDKVEELGPSFLRYGPPLYGTFLGGEPSGPVVATDRVAGDP